jgi:hypothetical protein
MWSEVNWFTLGVESVVGGLFEGLVVLLIGSWVLWRARRDLRAGRFNDTVIFSFNLIHQGEKGEPLLGFRTPLSGTLDEIFMIAPLIRELKAAAAKTTEDTPIIKLRDPRMHSAMQRQLINFCNQLNRDGQIAALTGQPFEEREHHLALVYEPGAQTKMFRIIPVSDGLIKALKENEGKLTFTHAYHADRLKVLKAIAAQREIDRLLPVEERTLTGFMISAPRKGIQSAQGEA